MQKFQYENGFKNLDTKITLQIRHYLIKYVNVDFNAVICINQDKAGSKFI